MKRLIEIIQENCIKYKNRDALCIQTASGNYRKYTYSGIHEEIESYSLKLKEAGVKEGDRIAIISENSPEWVISFFSLLSCSCTPVLIDPSLSSADLAALIEKSDIHALIVSPKILIKLDMACTTAFPVFYLTENGIQCNEENKNRLKSFPPTSDPDIDIISIIYSSGTTSTAKGVMFTNEAIITTAENNIISNELTYNDRFLAVIPLCHIYGFMAKMVCPLICGALVCFIEDINSQNLSKAFLEFQPTAFCGVPRIFDMFASKIISTVNAKGKFTGKIFKLLLNLSYQVRKHTGVNLGKVLFNSVHKSFGGKVRGFMSAGSLLDKNTAELYFSLGFYLLNNYGITETNIPIASNSFSHYTLDTCGKVFKDVQVSIRNANQQGIGDILVKSPGMMKGYFRDQEATEAAFDRSGWFRTGDLGFFDENQNLMVTGRIKENIILDTGKKVAPDDVEKAYGNIEGVAELVISAVPKSGSSYDEIHAFLVKDNLSDREHSSIESDLQQLTSNLPGHMRISKIHFVDSIPKTSLQKPKRYLLKQIALLKAETDEKAACTSEIQNDAARSASDLDTICDILSGFKFVCGSIENSHRLFEDLGFDSLSATEFCLLVEKRTGRRISSYLRANITVGEIAKLMGKTDNSDMKSSESFSRFPLQRRLSDIIIYKLFKRILTVLYRFEITGLENIPSDGNYLLCPNHETHFDAFFILANLPEAVYKKFCCLAKMEHMSNFFGRIMLRIGRGIPVDRYGNASPALTRCREKILEGSIVLIHPEGTRTNDGQIGPFKEGAAMLSIDTGSPIIPVRIKGGFEIYPKGKILPNLFDFKHLKKYQIEISFGKPLLPLSHDTNSLTSELKKRIMTA